MDMMDGSKLRVKVPTKMTGAEAKAYLLSKASAYFPHLNFAGPTGFVLKIVGLLSAMSDSLPLSRSQYIQACVYVFVMPVLEMIRMAEWDSRKEQDLTPQFSGELGLHTSITKLIGPAFKSFVEVEDDEISRLRSAMTVARLSHAKELAAAARQGRLFMLHEFVDVEVMPPVVPDSIMVSLRLPVADQNATTILVSPNETVQQVLEKACAKIRRLDPRRKDVPDKCLLKDTGRQSFLLGDTPFIRYDYVRSMICADKPVCVTLLDKIATLEAYPDEEVSNTSFMDNILASWQDDQVAVDPANSDQISKANLSEFSRPFKLKVHSVQGVPSRYMQRTEGEVDQIGRWLIYVKLTMFSGEGQLGDPQYSKLSESSQSLRWDQWLFLCPINQIPRGGRMCLAVYAVFTYETPAMADEALEKLSELVGWINVPLYDQYGVLLNGSSVVCFQLWSRDDVYDVMCQENLQAETRLYASFEETKKTIMYMPPNGSVRLGPSSQTAFASAEGRIMRIVHNDVLHTLTNEERKLLWDHRHHLTNVPEALPKVLRSVNWGDWHAAQDMYMLMREWCELKPAQVLQLVSGFFLDPFIRSFGVERLAQLSDADLLMFIPQLTQAIKYEPYHFNELAVFLVERALRNRHRLGHMFFWALKAEMHLPKVVGRYGCMLESYLRGAGTHRKELEMQNELVEQLVTVAKGLKEIKDKEERLLFLKQRLSGLNMPSRFQLPLDPRYEASGLIVDKCKFMSSKKVPLWLVFRNAEEGAPPITVIFKEGDDLRQDILTIQMLKIMNNLWKQDGLDLGMNPYGCIACGDQIGMIEVVANSQTTAGVARDYGGAKAVLQKDVMLKWLKVRLFFLLFVFVLSSYFFPLFFFQKHNETPELWARAQRNFMRSCAAYCVATYVLGIGDRHNDNIMCTRDGYLFHIDFGHFLGNFKSK